MVFLEQGTCPYVGTGGHLGCGGFGFPSRLWGLALDAVIEAQVVLANGSIVNASNTENEDLFFVSVLLLTLDCDSDDNSCSQAIRGAAPSFGIVTSLTVKTQSAPPTNILFNYAFSAPNSTIAAKTFLVFQKFGANNAPSQLGINVQLANGSFAFGGVYYGPQRQFENVIQPLLDAVPQPPINSSIKAYDWVGVLQQLGDDDGILNTNTKPDISDTFYAKSLMVAEDKPLTETALLSFFEYLYNDGTTTDTSWFTLVSVFF
jgi:hypothetical protein